MHPQSLTSEEIASFRKNGFLVVRQVVPPDILAELSRGANDLQKKYEDYRKEKDVYYT